MQLIFASRNFYLQYKRTIPILLAKIRIHKNFQIATAKGIKR